MMARIRKSMETRDEGFTLIELLVVMIIIGILAAVAIPVFLSQRAKARDSAAKADVSTIGKELASYFVDGTAPAAAAQRSFVSVTGTAPNQQYTINGANVGRVSEGVSIAAQKVVSADNWCVAVTVTGGTSSTAGFKYTASGGLEKAATASSACP